MKWLLFLVLTFSASTLFVGNTPHIPVIDNKQLRCVALSMFYEAVGETTTGQAAVARVILNRVNLGFAKTPCEVVYQAAITSDQKVCQFTWACFDPKEPKLSEEYRKIKELAYDIVVNNQYNNVIPDTAVYFHSVSVNPGWNHQKVVTIGNHIFYAQNTSRK